MNIQNISGRTVTITMDRAALTLAPNETATFPDTAKARADFSALKDRGIVVLFSDATHPVLSDDPFGAAVFHGAMLLATGQPTSGNYVTIQGKIFEFNNSAVATGRTAVAISGVNAGATYASLQTAVNADAELKAKGVRIRSRLVISAANDIRLAVHSPDELALTVSEAADNLTVTTPALITRAARQATFAVAATAATIAVDTGFAAVDAVIVQVRSATGVLKAYDGKVTVADGIVYLDAATGTVDIISTDIISLHVSGS